MSVHRALFSNLSCCKAENICKGENGLRNEIAVGGGICTTAVFLVLAKSVDILSEQEGNGNATEGQHMEKELSIHRLLQCF